MDQVARAETTFAGGVGAEGISVGTRQAEGIRVSRLMEGRGGREGWAGWMDGVVYVLLRMQHGHGGDEELEDL